MAVVGGAKRELNILVLAATGFTGKEVARYLGRCAAKNNLRWGIAGRNTTRLHDLAVQLEREGIPLPHASIECDINSEPSLHLAFKRTQLVLNCAGPYRFLGLQVARAAVAARTDVMDISGEPQYMDEVFLKLHTQAQDAGVLVLNACAFDSVPADLGQLFTLRQFSSPSACNAIESFLQINGGPQGIKGHYTTYECAVHGVGDIDALRVIREDIRTSFNPPRVTAVGPRLNIRRKPYFERRVGRYAMPFMGSDASVVRSSQRTLSMRGVEGDRSCQWPQYAAYVTIGSFLWLSCAICLGSLFNLLARSAYGRSLLLKYPKTFSFGVFSHEGPTREQLDQTSFVMTFYARGYSDADTDPHSDESTSLTRPERCDTTVVTRVKGPEPGYVATPIIFVTLACLLLRKRSHMPSGGVLTPSSAFYDVPEVFEELSEAGVTFEVVTSAQGRAAL